MGARGFAHWVWERRDGVMLLRSPRAVAIVLDYEASVANLRVIPDVRRSLPSLASRHQSIHGQVPVPRSAPRNVSTMERDSARQFAPQNHTILGLGTIWAGNDVGWERRDGVNMLRSPRAVAIALDYEASTANLRVIPDVNRCRAERLVI